MRLVITDLDGTLLDHETYSWEAAHAAVDQLRRRDIPLILCTSKTRAETEDWRKELGNEHPFIVENGGALLIPVGYFRFTIPFSNHSGDCELIQFGDSAADLRKILKEAA